MGGKTALFEAFAVVGKALGSPKRLELVDLLAQGERSVEVLAATAGLGLTSTSNHLQILKQSGLVATRKAGAKVFYRLSGDDVAALWALVRQVADTHMAEVDRARAAYLGPADTEHVTRAELLRGVQEGDVTLVDVRPREEYAAGHIPGARSIPVDELPARMDELPEEGTVVAYCRGAYCVFAHDAVRMLTGRGRDARRLEGGMLEWRLAALPVTTVQ